MSVTFHRLEDYGFGNKFEGVTVSFETDRFGYYQVTYTEHDGVVELKNEPDINMFTPEQQEYIEAICRVVWRMVHDTPAKKERFA